MRPAYDPTIYEGAAAHYTRGRPPYSRELAPGLAAELGLDGSGRLLDAGCGPGVLTLELAGLFEAAIGLDPDAAMLVEGERRAREAGIDNLAWVQALAEDIPTLGLGRFRLVTFGQSFHWTDRERVAEAAWDILEPGGTLALVVHDPDHRPPPPGPGYPRFPDAAIRALIDSYLGPRQRAGQGFVQRHLDRYDEALARTRFGRPSTIHLPGREDLVRDVDAVMDNYLSMSWAAPHLFGADLPAFMSELRALLLDASPSGLFWEWPGDTAIDICRRPSEG